MSQLIILLLLAFPVWTNAIETSNIKIPCGGSIDAAFWAHDGKPGSVYVFSGNKYFVWNAFNNSITRQELINTTWPNLPPSTDAACSFYHSSNIMHIFLKGDHYWLYKNYKLVATDLQKDLFTEAVPRDPDCFTCDPLEGGLIGFTTIGRNSLGSRACTASFDGLKFHERECSFKTEGTDDNFKIAYKKAGYCKALATNFTPEGRDYIYFGSEKIAIGKKADVRIESLDNLVDCSKFLTAISDPTIITGIALFTLCLILICIVCIACICKHCGKKYEEDSEGDFTEKPASAPSITAADPNET